MKHKYFQKKIDFQVSIYHENPSLTVAAIHCFSNQDI